MKSLTGILFGSFLLIGTTLSLCAQTNTKMREVGLNMTTLLSQVVPFNRTGTLIGPYQMNYIYLSPKNRGFRFSLGGQISEVFQERSHINVLFGFERRKWIGDKERFSFRRGTNLFISVGGLQTPLVESNNLTLFGIAVARGIEYHLAPGIGISTEAFFHLGINSDGFLEMHITPPFAINLNVKF